MVGAVSYPSPTLKVGGFSISGPSLTSDFRMEKTLFSGLWHVVPGPFLVGRIDRNTYHNYTCVNS